MSFIDKLFQKQIDKKVVEYQNEVIANHYKEVEQIYKQIRGWRHDYHNHIQTMQAFISMDETMQRYLSEVKNNNLVNYLSTLNDELQEIDTIVKTGNIMGDAIINSKLSIIKSKGIEVIVKANIPNKLSVVETDLCIILGNLFDNAIDSCMKFDGERFIRIYIDTLKNQLYISITNPASNIKRVGKSFATTKNKDAHGFGLMRIDRVVDKYNGYVERQFEEGFFTTEVTIPL